MLGQEMMMNAVLGMIRNQLGIQPEQLQQLMQTIFEFADTVQRVEGKLDLLLQHMESHENERVERIKRDAAGNGHADHSLPRDRIAG